MDKTQPRKSAVDGSIIIDSNHIKTLLANKFGGNSGARAGQHVFLTEVRNATGFYGSTRYADGLSMCMYPSQGLEIQGYEIKVSRGDWLSELKNPEKANEIMQYCDRWWLVCPKGVVNKDELPKNWGLMIATGKTLRIEKQAPVLEAVDLDRFFTASLLRSATEGVMPKETLHNEKKKSYDEGVTVNIKKAESAKERLEKYKGQVAIFEKASGIKVLDSSSWGDTEEKIKQVGTLVNFVQNGGIRSMKWDVESALKQAKEAVRELENVNEFALACKEINK